MTAHLARYKATSRLSCYIDGMEITVKVPDEIAEQAKARGMQVEAYVEDILAQRPAAPPLAEHPRSPAEIRAWLDSLAQFSDKIPPLPKTISREWIYQDHD
jgi:hypothetical protein